MKQLSILHLSDLHINHSDFANQRVVLDALWADLRKLRGGGMSFDIIIFSGDLVAKGNFGAENLNHVIKDFIEPLLLASDVTSNRLFLVPGNHDINTKNRAKTVERALTTLVTSEDVDQYLDEANAATYFPTGLDDFNKLIKSLGLSKAVLQTRHYWSNKLDIDGLSIGICSINSAWAATGSPSNGDYGRLIIGRKQLDDLIASVSTCELRLAVVHHPLSWLNHFESGPIRRQIALNFDAVFHGHNHDADASQIAGTTNSYFVSNAGCLYQSREYFNGYSIIHYNGAASEWKVNAREYIESRHCFDISSRFASDGAASFSAPNDKSSIVSRQPTQEYLQALNENANGSLLSVLISDIAPKALPSLFVDPPLSRTSQRQSSRSKRKTQPTSFVSFRDALGSSKPIFFVGPKEAGKTTLLHRITLLTSEDTLIDFPPFGVYVDLAATGQTRASILTAFVSSIKGAYSRSELSALMDHGLVVACLDNLNINSARQTAAIAELVQNYPRVRYYFSLREELNSALSPDVIPRFGLDAEVLYLQSFGRRETRLLAERWFGISGGEVSPQVDEILSSLARLNIPRTPFLISTLLWIKESNISFSPVNQSEIIDALIDGVLEKLTESKDRSGLDSTVKRHFLGGLAQHLSQNRTATISNNDLEEFTLHYFKSKALASPTGPFLEELCNRGILLRLGETVVFKFDCMRAFFLASRFSEDPDLLQQALTEENFLRFGEELDYFTGRHRDQEAVLVKAMALLNIFSQKAELGLDLNLFDEVSMHDSPFTPDQQGALMEKVLGSRPTDKEREVILDDLALEDSGQNPHETRAQEVGDFSEFVRALQIVSAILRNSELVSNPSLKHASYNTISECWCQILIAVLVALDFLQDDPKAFEDFSVLLPLDNPKLARYFLKVLAPNVVLSMALESVGSQKLQVIIKDAIAKEGPTVKGVMNTFLYLDLELPDRYKYLSEFMEKSKGNRFISELIYFKIVQEFLFKSLSHADEARVRALVGDSLVTMMSAPNRIAADNLRTRALSDLERKRLTTS